MTDIPCWGDGFPLQVPPAHVEGDFSVETFTLSKSLKQSPQVLAAKIVDAINSAGLEYIEKARANGPFVNVDVYRDKINSIHRFFLVSMRVVRYMARAM